MSRLQRSSRLPRWLLALAALALVAGACAGEDEGSSAPAATVTLAETCDWSTAGHSAERAYATGCDDTDAVGLDTLDRLVPVWSIETEAEVTGAPAVTDDAVYFGDWSGRIHAVDRATGETRWTRDTPPHPAVYAGQIPTSPTVTELDGEQVLVIASGKTVWALRAADGEPVWDRELGIVGDDEDPTEIQGSLAVADGMVLVPTDVHNNPGQRSGLVALSLADGTDRWTWDPEEGKPAGGCGSLWGTPSVQVEERLVVVGTGSCFSEESWNRYSEAIVGVDLDTGEPRWSYQPREELNSQDWDFAAAPNLFSIGDRKVVGLGSKDGSYYVVDRTDGELVWSSRAVRQEADGDGFAFGGFIGATAVAPDDTGRLVVAGGTAVGDCPCQHGFDAATGDPLWQSTEAGGTYGASAAAGGVVFTAGIDQTLRAYDLTDGKVRWEQPLRSLSASGPSIAGDLVVIGVGFREPGRDAPPSGGVQAFRVLAEGETAPSSSTTTLPDGPAVTELEPSEQACVGVPCELGFTLKEPPAGRTPSLTLEVTPSPLRISVQAEDLGEPEEWLGEDGPASSTGATVFAVFITPRDDRPELGSIVCVLRDGACTGEQIDLPAESYTRLSVLALADGGTLPSLQEGYDRLVTTHSFDPGLVPAA
jgi:outer membrane protein assembly factor BamB